MSKGKPHYVRFDHDVEKKLINDANKAGHKLSTYLNHLLKKQFSK